MEIKNVKIYGLEESIIRSGYPMQIGEPDDLDTKIFVNFNDGGDSFETSDLDNKRAKRLAKSPAGSGHDNFLKGIIVQFDLQYPEYFSPQLQRYNWISIISSQSKMHRIASRELTKDDFTEHVLDDSIELVNYLIKVYKNDNNYFDDLIKAEFGTKEDVFNSIISNLPSGYLKWMGISTNYLQLKTIYFQRKNHKLNEWRYFCDWIKTLPMFKELILK